MGPSDGGSHFQNCIPDMDSWALEVGGFLEFGIIFVFSPKPFSADLDASAANFGFL